MYWICSAAALISIVCILPMRETNGIDLEDKIYERHALDSNGIDSNEKSVKKIFEEEEEKLNAL
jgi:hypothetical protein